MTIDGDDAKAALDRITIPQEVLDRIGPTALPRSSIIISDEPLSAETNYRTEFVAVLSNQPQGGFITRKPTPKLDIPMASGDDTGWGSFFQPWGQPAPAMQSGNPMVPQGSRMPPGGKRSSLGDGGVVPAYAPNTSPIPTQGYMSGG